MKRSPRRPYPSDGVTSATRGSGVAPGEIAGWSADGPRRVLGIMSGTSLDGVDCVVTEFDAEGKPRWVRQWGRRYPKSLRRRLWACASGAADAWECARLHHDLGRFYAGVAGDGLAGDRIQAVGLHGQTVFHRGRGPARATWQIGEPAYLAEALRVPVVFNFRAADLAAGGEGAPLATLFHVRAFGIPGRHVCVQNLGGIGNVTSIDARRGGAPEIRSFDTGPGNLLIDGAVGRLTAQRRTFDRDGAWAARGTVCEALLGRWLRHPFFRRPPPKSTGREVFGDAYLERCWREMDRVGLGPEDRLATLTELTARSVAADYSLHVGGVPSRVVVAGGGAKNAFLMRRLAVALGEVLPGIDVGTTAAWEWPVDAVEGGAFALLARERLAGRPGNLPETTGASRAVRCGAVIEP